MLLDDLRAVLDDIADHDIKARGDTEVIVLTAQDEPMAIRSVLVQSGDVAKVFIRLRSSL